MYLTCSICAFALWLLGRSALWLIPGSSGLPGLLRHAVCGVVLPQLHTVSLPLLCSGRPRIDHCGVSSQHDFYRRMQPQPLGTCITAQLARRKGQLQQLAHMKELLETTAASARAAAALCLPELLCALSSNVRYRLHA